MLSKLLPFSLLGTALLLGACGGGNFDLADLVKPPAGSSPAGPPGVTQVKGEVKDPDGRAVAGATVTLRRSGPDSTTTTDADGRFTFTPPASGVEPYLSIDKTGYATHAKSVPVANGKSTTIAIRLFPDQVSRTFAAAAGTTLAFGGTSVVIPVNALLTAELAPYRGNVQVSASYFSPNTLLGVQAFPAGHRSLSPGARDVEQPLISLGVIELKLRDAAGQALTLQASVPVTLTFPATSSDTAGANLGLSRYDAPNGGWFKDTVATRQPDGSLVATPAESNSTFSGPLIWTVNLVTNRAQINGCFRDAGGQPIADVGVFGLRGTGWESPSKGASAEGGFSFFPVAADVPLELYSLEQPPAFASVAIPPTASAPASAPRQLPCITTKARPAGTAWTISLMTTLFAAP